MKILKLILFVVPLLVSSQSFAGKKSKDQDGVCGKDQEIPLQDKITSMAEIILKSDMPDSKDNKGLDFKVNLDHMAKGGNQLGIEIEGSSDFRKHFPEFKRIDFDGVIDKGNYVWATKNAYVIDVDPQFFSDDLLNDPDYQQKTNKDMMVERTDRPNVLKFIKTNNTFMGKSRPDVTSMVEGLSYDLSKNSGDIPKSQLDVILSQDANIGAKPERISLSFSRESSDDKIKGSTTLTKFYRIAGENGDKTLLVSYYMLALDIGFWEKAGMALAVPGIKMFATGATQENVVNIRKTVREKQAEASSQAK